MLTSHATHFGLAERDGELQSNSQPEHVMESNLYTLQRAGSPGSLASSIPPLQPFDLLDRVIPRRSQITGEGGQELARKAPGPTTQRSSLYWTFHAYTEEGYRELGGNGWFAPAGSVALLAARVGT